jgi:hypothetical protein
MDITESIWEEFKIFSLLKIDKLKLVLIYQLNHHMNRLCLFMSTSSYLMNAIKRQKIF